MSGRLTLAAALLALVFHSSVQPVSAQSPAEQTGIALQEMRQWLGDDANAQRWHRYLRTPQVEAQISLGDAASIEVLGDALAQYNSGYAGLELPEFREARLSIAAWVTHLRSPAGPNIALADLPAAIREARSQFNSIDQAEVTSAKAQLDRAINQLEQTLHSQGADASEAWREKLHWETMQTALASSDSPDLGTLDKVWRLYRSNEPGLEDESFTRVRDALRSYIDLSYYASAPEIERMYERLIDELATTVESYLQEPSSALLHRIGSYTGKLSRAKQVPELVAAIRSQFNQPNLLATVSADLLAAGVNNTVSDVTPVRENILGTDLYGTAHTTGQLSLRPMPNTEQAMFQIRLQGHTETDNIGYNRGITVNTSGYTEIDAVKTILLNGQGYHSRQAVANCQTTSTIHSLCARLAIIERIAWKKAMEQKCEAEAIASCRAEQRVAQRVDQQTAEMVSNSQNSFDERFRLPLLRRGEYPSQLNFSTTADELMVRGLQANDLQLGAPALPPEVDGEYAVQVRLHESMVMNFAEAVIGGEILTDERLAEILEERTGEVPEELQIGPDKDPWSITFDNQAPVRVAFRDNLLTLAITGRRFTRAEQALNQRMEISASYAIQQTDSGLLLTRQGEVEIDFVDIEGQLGTRQIAFKAFMRLKWESLFKPEIQTEGIVLPGALGQAGKLLVENINSGDGWLSLGWNQQPTEEEATSDVALHTRQPAPSGE